MQFSHSQHKYTFFSTPTGENLIVSSVGNQVLVSRGGLGVGAQNESEKTEPQQIQQKKKEGKIGPLSFGFSKKIALV